MCAVTVYEKDHPSVLDDASKSDGRSLSMA